MKNKSIISAAKQYKKLRWKMSKEERQEIDHYVDELREILIKNK